MPRRTVPYFVPLLTATSFLLWLWVLYPFALFAILWAARHDILFTSTAHHPIDTLFAMQAATFVLAVVAAVVAIWVQREISTRLLIRLGLPVTVCLMIVLLAVAIVVGMGAWLDL